jgi:hypothetical protein
MILQGRLLTALMISNYRYQRNSYLTSPMCLNTMKNFVFMIPGKF